MDRADINDKISAMINTYIENTRKDLTERWNTWTVDPLRPELTEVIFGLIARQITIVTHYAAAPTFWNGDLAPIILRSMVDSYINFAWILVSPEERTKQFIMHGLGQEKLRIEHLKKQIELDGHDANTDPGIRHAEMWVSAQRYPFLTPVNLGSWSDLNTRKMAEEAGCIDIYNYVYQPFSTAAHNMWNHISRYNLMPSDNPLHRFLLMPTLNDWDPELNYLQLGAKYLGKMIVLFDKTFHHKPIRSNAFDILNDELAEIRRAYAMLDDEQRSE